MIQFVSEEKTEHVPDLSSSDHSVNRKEIRQTVAIVILYDLAIPTATSTPLDFRAYTYY